MRKGWERLSEHSSAANPRQRGPGRGVRSDTAGNRLLLLPGDIEEGSTAPSTPSHPSQKASLATTPLSTQTSSSPHPVEVTPVMDCAAVKFHKSPSPQPRRCSHPMDAMAQPWADSRLHCLTAHLGGIGRKGMKKRQEVLSALKINSKNAEKLKSSPKSPLGAQEGASLPLAVFIQGWCWGHFSPTLQESSSGSSQSQIHWQGFACFILARCICGKLKSFLGKTSPVMFLSFSSDTLGWGGSW